MPNLETLQAQIHGIEDLQSVVRTMKALAMVRIRQYEKARLSLSDYTHTVELGLQALLHHRHFSENPLGLPLSTTHSNHRSIGVIIFGSDHGLCGPFNEQIVTYTLGQLHDRPILLNQCLLAGVGTRLIPYLETAQQPIQRVFNLPNSLAGIPDFIQDLLLTIEQWCFGTHLQSGIIGIPEVPQSFVEQILLFYNQPLSSTDYQPFYQQLLPLDLGWLQHLEQRPWQSSSLPNLGMDWENLFSTFIRQYLFISLYQATIESLTSENAARLASMQTAEKNIEERLTALNGEYRQQRQNIITGELLDILSGFEALKQTRRY